VSNTQQTLAKAFALHQAGNLVDAAHLYQEILAIDPVNADALNLLGVVFQVAKDFDTSILLLEQACAAAPDYCAPLVNLGNVYQESGRLEEALGAFQRAICLDPKSAAAYNNLASCLNALNRYEDAMQACVDGLKLDAKMCDLHVNMGNAMLNLGNAENSLKAFEKSVKFGGHENPNAWFNMGNALGDLGRFAEACEAFAKAVELEDANAEIHYNYANALQQVYRFEEAVQHFEVALTLQPQYVDAYCNLASAYQSLGESAKAVELLQSAMRFDPDSVDLHWNLSLALLQSGQYEQGWAEYEWRWKTPTFADFRRDFAKPAWAGENLDGRTILIHAEQGFGDGIQFIRYLPLVAQKGGRVVLECRPQLKRLFSTVEGVDEICALGDPLPNFDVHVPVMSLPYLMKTTLESVPRAVPYLTAPVNSTIAPALFETADYKVGLVWAGSPTRKDNLMRSCPLQDLSPLLGISGARFYSLQVGPFQSDLQDIEGGEGIVDLAPLLNDFADTASALRSLDVLVSVDTGVLHLAGALGLPTLALMSQPTGFLWMDHREDSPWYPTIRLFRQPHPGRWEEPVERVRAELEVRVASRGG